jgi:hypothetical protein
MLVALVALFVALGGPAQARRLIDGADIAKGTIRGTQIKDRTIGVRDISKAAVRQLQSTPAGSINAAKLGGAAVTAGKIAANAVTTVTLADGAVGTTKLADGSVNGAKIADGSLTTNDIARFSGRFKIAAPYLTAIGPHSCWTGEPQTLAPEVAGADISQDAVLVTPLGPNYDEKSLSLTARTSGSTQPSRFVLSICNVTDGTVQPPPAGISFSYVVFDIP